MARRSVFRAVSVSVCLVLGVASLGLVPGAGVAEPPLSIEQAQARVDELYEEAEAATERAHDATYEVGLAKERLARVQRRIDVQRDELDVLSESIADIAAAMYASGGVDPSLQLMLASDPESFLLQAQSLSQVTGSQDAELRRLETAQLALAQSRESADQELVLLQDFEATAAKEQTTVDAKLAEAKAVLARLEEKERRQLEAMQTARAASANENSRDALRDVPTPSPSTNGGGSGRAAAAVAYAQAQVGKSYVFGAAGPSSFDCSGLTMMAWAQAGVSLPHASSQQFAMTTRVSNLQPGDLVFFYPGQYHVGIYVGNGIFVHAANPNDGVVAESLYTDYWQSVYQGAGRI